MNWRHLEGAGGTAGIHMVMVMEPKTGKIGFGSLRVCNQTKVSIEVFNKLF